VASKNKPEARERSRRKKKVTQNIARLLGLPQEHEEESKPQQPEGWDLSRCRDARVGCGRKEIKPQEQEGCKQEGCKQEGARGKRKKQIKEEKQAR